LLLSRLLAVVSKHVAALIVSVVLSVLFFGFAVTVASVSLVLLLRVWMNPGVKPSFSFRREAK
jgi:hypothetical protein